MSSTTCPVNVKVVPVSTTVNPVTHTALVEVNKASVKLIPSYVALGNLSKTAPNKMMNKKLAAKELPLLPDFVGQQIAVSKVV